MILRFARQNRRKVHRNVDGRRGDLADEQIWFRALAPYSIVRSLRPITAIHWNAFGGAEAGDLITADSAALRGIFDVAVFGLLTAVREALPDLKSARDGA